MADSSQEQTPHSTTIQPSTPRVTRQKWFRSRALWMVIVPLFVLLFIWCHFIEPNRILVRHVVLPASLIRGKVTRPIRILHLSDFHMKSTQAVLRAQDAIEKGMAHHPDIAVLTGDYELPPSEELVRQIQLALTVLTNTVPTYAILGNHEYESLCGNRPEPIVKMLQDAGVHVLEHADDTLFVNGQKIHISGTYPTLHPHADGLLTKLDDLPPNPPERPLTLALIHRSTDLSYYLDKYDFDVAFAGHGHGGQIRIPFTDWTPFSHRHFDGPVAKGLYPLPDGKRFLCLTSGVGNFLELRFCCFPEAVIMDITP